jgi:hypothetical protein
MNKENPSDIKQLIAMAVQTINSRFDALDVQLGSRFDDIDVRFATIEDHLTEHDAEFAAIHARFDETDKKNDKRFTAIDERFEESAIIQNEISNTVGEMHEGYLRALSAQADRGDDHERRIVKLEKRTA